MVGVFILKAIPMPEAETEIRDDEPSTQGGPPKWLAFVIVMLLFFVVALTTVLVLAFF